MAAQVSSIYPSRFDRCTVWTAQHQKSLTKIAIIALAYISIILGVLQLGVFIRGHEYLHVTLISSFLCMYGCYKIIHYISEKTPLRTYIKNTGCTELDKIELAFQEVTEKEFNHLEEQLLTAQNQDGSYNFKSYGTKIQLLLMQDEQIRTMSCDQIKSYNADEIEFLFYRVQQVFPQKKRPSMTLHSAQAKPIAEFPKDHVWTLQDLRMIPGSAIYECIVRQGLSLVTLCLFSQDQIVYFYSSGTFEKLNLDFTQFLKSAVPLFPAAKYHSAGCINHLLQLELFRQNTRAISDEHFALIKYKFTFSGS